MPASSSKTCLPLTSPSATYQDGPGYFWEKIVLRPGPPPAPNPAPPPPDPLPLPVEKPAQADKFDESVVRCRDGTDPCQSRIAQHIMGRTMLTNVVDPYHFTVRVRGRKSSSVRLSFRSPCRLVSGKILQDQGSIRATGNARLVGLLVHPQFCSYLD
jgi:hypothetical protein